jgi:glycosyltransferase involved in cell wall biosynthesis
VTHRAELAELIEDDPRLRERVRLADAVVRSELPRLFASVDAVVSPNEPLSGATFDKAVFEAAACARPVVSTNEAFAPLLGGLELPLLAPPSDPPALADTLSTLVAATSDERARVGLALRSRVVAGHSLDHWADAVIAAVGEVRSPRGG